MKPHILTIPFFLLSALSLSAQKYDYQWPFGYLDSFELNFGISLLDFNDQLTTTFPFFETDKYGMDAGGSFICDADGQLMLMTNNCFVLDRDFNIVEGLDTLTPGSIYDEFCLSEDGTSDYPSDEVSLFLPEMTNDSINYLLNKDFEILGFGSDVIARNTYLSTIIKRTDGSFYIKERRILIEDMPIISRRTTACIHEDGQRWWTWSIEYDSNRFYKFLIGGDMVVEDPIIQEIGVDLKSLDLSLGQAAFSPNAQHLAINSVTYGVLLYDFDNSTGELSNFRAIPYPDMHTAKGLSFSPSSRFIYTSTGENMYQIDIEEPDTSQRVFHIGHFRSQAEDGWPVGLGNMFLGPDCRIYVAPGTTTWYMHTIHQPDEKGAACNFEERAIRTPTNVEHNLPNIPMYRFGGACDNSIEWGIVSAMESSIAKEEADIILYPNPVGDVLQIKNVDLDARPFTITFFNVLGQRMFSVLVNKDESSIDVSLLPKGIFFYTIRRDGRLLSSGKVEKII